MNRLIKFIPLVIISCTFLVSSWFSPQLPSQFATHWGIDGQVDGFASKTFGMYFVPSLSIALYLLFLFLPSTEAYRPNFKKFEKHYDQFVVVIFLFLSYIHLLTIVWNLGHHFEFTKALSPAFSVLFLFIGRLLSVAKRNCFVGIRTPWTMKSDFVWAKTHQVGSKLFAGLGVISLSGLFIPSQYFFGVFFASTITITLFCFVYSWSLSIFSGQA